MKCPVCNREQPKTIEQRNLFHSMCRDIGKFTGETPGHIKAAIKADYFGIDEFKVGSKWYKAVRSSESAQRAEYSDLIDYTKIWAAENLNYIFGD